MGSSPLLVIHLFEVRPQLLLTRASLACVMVERSITAERNRASSFKSTMMSVGIAPLWKKSFPKDRCDENTDNSTSTGLGKRSSTDTKTIYQNFVYIQHSMILQSWCCDPARLQQPAQPVCTMSSFVSRVSILASGIIHGLWELVSILIILLHEL